ncbi:MAG: hypothetical protein ABJN22_09950 [Litorimonas sp.]
MSLPILGSLCWWLLGYGPWVGTSIDVSEQRPLFTLMALQGFFSAIPVSAVCLWAAHNLKSLSFISATKLARYCWLGIVSCVIAFGLSILEAYATFVVYEEDRIFGLGNIAYMGQFLVYGIANTATLIFARLQLKQKLAGETIQEPSLVDTFS